MRTAASTGPVAALSYLLDRWIEVADHELTTRETNEGYIGRAVKPALGDMTLLKHQHRVDLLDRLYTHLHRCNACAMAGCSSWSIIRCDRRPGARKPADIPGVRPG